MRYILNHEPVLNLDKVIVFELDGQRLVRRLVMTIHAVDEISPASPVGYRLANARPGATFEIPQPDPDPCVVVKVLDILDSLAQAAPA